LVEDLVQSLPLERFKKIAIPLRIFFIIIIAIEFFKLHTYLGIESLPTWLLGLVFTLTMLHLMGIAKERNNLVTTEIENRKCPICEKQMYSKMIKCEICKIQIDTDDEKP